MVLVDFSRMLCATTSGSYPSFATARMTLLCNSELAYGPPLRTRDTLPTDVPAALATSRIVGRRVIQLAFSTITADRPSLDARPAMECPWGQASQKAFHSIRSEEHTSELQSLMRISYAVFCL